ncbi:MAG TPA: sigma-54-dependent Fis family transcriptional regulator [Candidatus Krumholzibacterium sp.]|nr:sigma-54-dependent Fis family transcriptional regulator [Candidatus Krumholzibacterium sp.]
MQAEDLKLEDIITFSEGILSLDGRRFVLHDIHAMAQLRKDLVSSIGADQTRRIMARFGYYWGKADAASMERLHDWESPEEWLKAGPKLHAIEGLAKTEIVDISIGENGTFRMDVIWHDSAEADEQLIELGVSRRSGCWVMEGYASGYASYCLRKPVYFREESCRCRGDRICEVVGKDLDSWGAEANQFIEEFESEDFQGKVEDLMAELRKKTLDLARRHKRLQQSLPLRIENTPELKSKLYAQVLDTAFRVARFDTSVLITGESGVGKEVIARFIHDSSPRRRNQFVAMNCAAMPETLLTSELFGHVKGSFTSAVRDRVGLFEEASGGTILLDEIGDISPALQIALLRVLQERQIRRVGDNRDRPVDVRVIASTNQPLKQLIRDGKFREDLYYRLGVVEVEIPPLRDRKEDILPLARFFVSRLAKKLKIPNLKMAPSTIRYLERYCWPGNIRELENVLERASVLTDDGLIHPEHLPGELTRKDGRENLRQGDSIATMAEMERDHIDRVLKAANGNRSRAAEMLGIGKTTLWRKLKESGLDS